MCATVGMLAAPDDEMTPHGAGIQERNLFEFEGKDYSNRRKDGE